MKLLTFILIIYFLCTPAAAIQHINQSQHLDFDDSALDSELVYPEWFKISLGNLDDDLRHALDRGKIGIIVYYGQKRCAYCQEFFETIQELKDIQRYLRDHYDIIPVDIWGVEEMIDTDGKIYSEHGLALRYKTNFTPSLIFYDSEGTPVFRLRGFHPPYNLMAALKYSVEGFYKKENFRDYLERAVPGIFFKQGDMNERNFFSSQPYDLKTISDKSDKPLAVFFEQGNCHACDVLHTGPLNENKTLNEIKKMSSIQLNMWSDTPVITPSGKKITAQKWASELGLFYAPTIIFFDDKGREIIRLDSVVKFYRLLGVLSYINSKGYIDEPNYQTWRLKQRKTR
jgi:thioredoxin-related protein